MVMLASRAVIDYAEARSVACDSLPGALVLHGGKLTAKLSAAQTLPGALVLHGGKLTAKLSAAQTFLSTAKRWNN